jgi:hypothetical protein
MPMHLLKITFKISDVVDDVAEVSIWSHPAFKTAKGRNYELDWSGGATAYSGEAVSYAADELAGVECKLSTELFFTEDIKDFLFSGKEDVF